MLDMNIPSGINLSTLTFEQKVLLGKYLYKTQHWKHFFNFEDIYMENVVEKIAIYDDAGILYGSVSASPDEGVVLVDTYQQYFTTETWDDYSIAVLNAVQAMLKD